MVLVNEEYRKTLTHLIEETRAVVEKYHPGDAWIITAMAQRASADTKVKSSIE